MLEKFGINMCKKKANTLTPQAQGNRGFNAYCCLVVNGILHVLAQLDEIVFNLVFAGFIMSFQLDIEQEDFSFVVFIA